MVFALLHSKNDVNSNSFVSDNNIYGLTRIKWLTTPTTKPRPLYLKH